MAALLAASVFSTGINAQGRPDHFGAQMEVACGAGITSIRTTNALTAAVGYRLSPSFFAGVGAGVAFAESPLAIRPHLNPLDNISCNTLASCFIRGIYHFNPERKFHPFATVDAGWKFLVNNERYFPGVSRNRIGDIYYDKLFFEPQVGIEMWNRLYLTCGLNASHFLYKGLYDGNSNGGMNGTACLVNFHLGVML